MEQSSRATTFVYRSLSLHVWCHIPSLQLCRLRCAVRLNGSACCLKWVNAAVGHIIVRPR